MLLVLSLGLGGCTKVPSGQVGVKVNMLGGEKGVETEVLDVGWYFLSPNEQLHLFPTFTQNYVWTADAREGSETDESISFQTAEGLTVNGDWGITYTINKSKVSEVFQKYRRGVDEITDVYLRNIVRDEVSRAASIMKVDSVYGNGKSQLLSNVLTEVQNKVGPVGIDVESVYLVSNLRLPPSVEESINNKIGATQKAEQRENEINTAKAQALIEVEKAQGEANARMITAKAEADANRLVAASLTPVMVQYQSVLKWDGKLPTVSGSNAGMLINSDKIFEQPPSPAPAQ